ncbi:hypothetical protein E3O48_13505 [Cryobacterium sp. HLT2-28]|nr:hypothetical protein E3O48_13505 [Cryobacterium sp. HLT2-28]
MHEQAGQTESVEALIRRAATIVTDNALRLSPSKVSRLVRAHVRRSGSVQVAARMLEAYVLSYSDVTGETAVRNVMAEKR